MFGLQPWHLLVIIAAALVIFGPDKLPGLAKDAGKMLRQLRRMADGVREDLKEELGPELGSLDLASMHPRALIHKHLLDPALDDVDEAKVPSPSPAPAVTAAAQAAALASAPTAAAPSVGQPYDEAT